MSEDTDYNPRSPDAMFTKLLGKIEAMAHNDGIYRADMRQVTTEIKELLMVQNGRVAKLERWRDTVTAKISIIAMIAGGFISFLGWIIPFLLKK